MGYRSVLLTIGLASVPVVAVFSVHAMQSRSGQVDCADICVRDRLSAPPECDCDALESGKASAEKPGTGKPAPGYMSAGEFKEYLRAAWERSVASIQNYTVVEQLKINVNAAPVPVVHYYEKVVQNGKSEFRAVPPTEMAKREAEAAAAAAGGPRNGAELSADPTRFLEALAQGLETLSASGPGPQSRALAEGLAGRLRKVQSDVRAQGDQDAKDADTKIIDALAQELQRMGVAADELFGLYHPYEPTRSQRFELRPDMSWAYEPDWTPTKRICEKPSGTNVTGDCFPIPDDALLCYVETIYWGSVDRQTRPEITLEGTVHTVEAWEDWTCMERDGRYVGRVYFKVQGVRHDVGGFTRFAMEREFGDFRPVQSMNLPHRSTERVQYPALLQAFGGPVLNETATATANAFKAESPNAMEIVKTIVVLGVDQGAPSQAEIAKVMAQPPLQPSGPVK